ncbi:MAG: lipid-A-disaccharide synthase [Desulfovibrio sp.]|jgi:lipid-A-disaccharide synthase|nr:lipid-A-disaccharide synthase [Desulfovibrio sp.]
MSGPLIWINAGEVSGDMHGALLLEALRRACPALRFAGTGGPRLEEAGLETRYRIEDLSVMGITEVIGHLPKILRMLRRIARDLAVLRPAALIVIDAPDFNFRVLRAAAALGIPAYYYISPKLWAWRAKRAVFIKNTVRRLISILPFETEFYRRFQMDVDYVGNPLADMMDYPSLCSVPVREGLVGLMPGSRRREVLSLLPEFGGAARLLLRRQPGLTFACLRAPGMDESLLRSLWPDGVPLTFIGPERRFAFMRSCAMIIAASGTATLECALAGTPAIIVYKVSPLSFIVGKLLVKTPFMGLPNLILEREIFPELLQEACDAAPLAKEALKLLDPVPGARTLADIRAELEELRSLLGPPGAADRAARLILEDATLSAALCPSGAQPGALQS